MDKMIILQGVTVDALLAHIDAIVDKRLNEIIEKLIPKKGIKYLTRKEVSQILKVSLPTLNVWTKEGKINSYRIGSRVLYKSDEVEDALIKRKYR